MTELSSHTPEETRHAFKYADIVTVIFVLVLVISNIASSAKIIDWGISLFSLPLAFDAGTLLFPIAYIFGDILTEVYGFKRARRIIWIGFLCLAFSALVFWIIRIMPGESQWQQTTGQDAFDKVFGGMYTGGIVIASILGYLTGSFSNAIVMALLKVFSRGKLLWVRTISSTLVGELLDTVIFILVASITRVFPWELFWTLTVTNYIFKVGVEVIMTPLTYLIVNKLKKAENVDIFDERKDLNPFQFSD
jgi:hypothetical protein